MSELRWHPILEEWVITATHRMDRTFLPPDDFCPLCPTRSEEYPTEIPAQDYEIVTFENRFPSLQHPPPKPAVRDSELYKVRPADGICEVLCYTSRHTGTLTDATVNEIRNLVEVWADRFRELGSKDFIDYVLIFENKGTVIGVTLTHPHGQIYAFPFVPPKIQRELQSASKHMATTGRCLFCDIIKEEVADGRRIVVENNSFIAVVPFFARFPYEVYVFPKRHHQTMLTLDDNERCDLAGILKAVLLKYDNLWGISMPYMMIMHQAPTDGRDYGYYHYHIEFHPPHRTKDKLKYLAGCETGAGTYIVDALPEETAAKLREAEPSTMNNTFLEM
ncbi:MAG: galactose-1-phosphate uridylyltransferase [Armatimonadota bacterium]|nr:galactose-1-phosphate uridylyltransferase [Armatimonadota bacterium]